MSLVPQNYYQEERTDLVFKDHPQFLQARFFEVVVHLQSHAKSYSVGRHWSFTRDYCCHIAVAIE